MLNTITALKNLSKRSFYGGKLLKNKEMSTPRQRLAVKKLVENGRGETVGKTLVKAGYSKNTAIAPTKVTKSKGFIEAMEEAGLTDTFLNKCLQEDIKGKPRNRKAELELAYKLKGRLKDEKQEVEIKINLTSYGDNNTGKL
jgi:hypothetical protein